MIHRAFNTPAQGAPVATAHHPTACCECWRRSPSRVGGPSVVEPRAGARSPWDAATAGFPAAMAPAKAHRVRRALADLNQGVAIIDSENAQSGFAREYQVWIRCTAPVVSAVTTIGECGLGTLCMACRGERLSAPPPGAPQSAK